MRCFYRLAASVVMVAVCVAAPPSVFAQNEKSIASQGTGAVCQSVPGLIVGTSNAVNLTSNICEYAKKNEESVVAQINTATAIGFKNALSFFLKTMASDVATRLATAGEGQTSLIDQRPLETVLLNAADGAAGTFINDLTSAFGVNLCSPDLNVKLRISFGLRGFAKPVAPRCTLSELGRNWRDWAVQLRDDPQGFLQSVADVGFDVQGQDLGIALDAQSQMLQRRADAQRSAELKRTSNGAFKDVTDKVSGAISTPGTLLRSQVEQSTITGPGAAWAYTGDAVADGIDAFTNTLAQQLMQRMMRGLVGLFSGGDDVQLAQFDAQFGSAGRAARIAEVNSQTLNAPVIRLENYNLLQLYALCPDARNPGLNNCVIDSKFKQAIDQKLTVKQAIEQKLLNPDWAVGYSDLASGKEPSYTEGYGYTNLKKLRFARVLPVGWELAAQKAKELGEIKTLGQLIGEYRRTDAQGTCSGTGASAYCGLVDPDWVLRAFPMQCDAQTFGNQLTSTGTRELTCTDLKTCVKEDGTACQSYGYCFQERNTWKFDADSCRAQFASCQTFTRTSDNSQVSYIVSTVDKSVCNAANAGCRGYALEKNANQQWKIGDGDAIAYINSQAPACDAQDAGCGELIRLGVIFDSIPAPDQTLAAKFPSGYGAGPDRVTLLKQPPAWLGCTGLATDRAECAGYAQVCTRSEVGCERYTPTDGAPPVAGVITQGDLCPAQCVGYSSFVQMATAFEKNAASPIAFIPSTARTCSAEAVGCSEFTNVGAAAGQGGEAREYYTSVRACRKPTDAERTGEVVLDTTYYTWEGAADTGFQLKTWRLEKSNLSTKSEGGQEGTGNAPCTNFDVVSNTCNDIQARWIATDLPLSSCKDSYKPGQEGHNPDCREFFDRGGRIFYREYSKTVVVTPDCVTLRKSGATSQDECVGGTFANGVCLYNTYRPESDRCDASQNECRAYKGNAGNNVQVIIDDSLEGGIDGRAYKAANQNIGNLSTSNVALNRGGKSLSFSGTNIFIKTPLSVGSITDFDAYTLQITLLTEGAAQATGIKLATVQGNTVTSTYSFLNRVVGTGWKLLTLDGDLIKPARTDVIGGGAAVPDGVYLFVSRPDADTTVRYIDSIRLTKAQDFRYVIRNSWNTPVACDTNDSGAFVKGAQLGCREYRARDNKLVELKSFTKLCDDGKVGCEAFADTKNTLELGPVVVDGGTPAVTEKGRYTIPADELKYFVYNGQKGPGTCAPTKNGCTELGLITYDTAQKRTPQSAQSVYKIVLPRDYGSILCTGTGTASELFCEEYKRAGASTYFKSPEGKTCEYRDDFGWVKQGTTQPCEGRATRDVLAAAGSGNYAQWVGMCPSDQDSCKKFVDPTDTVNGAYYYKENKRLEELRASCNGKVSQKDGCVLFYDALLFQTPYNAQKTYDASDKARGALVTPISEAPNDTNTIIRVTRDRECSLWAACRTWTRDEDGAIVCGDYAGCTQLTSNGDITACGAFVPPNDQQLASQITYQTIRADKDILKYNAKIYTGYSIPGAYPFVGARQVSISLNNNDTCDTATGRCRIASTRQCFNDRDCKQDIVLRPTGVNSGGVTQSCRAYPEPIAPTRSVDGTNTRENTRDCKQGICECSYRVYSSGGVSGAYPLTTSIPRICAQGDTDNKGKSCRTDNDCFAGDKVLAGACAPVDAVEDKIGGYGYCLDTEGRRNDGKASGCIAWYPGMLTQGKASAVFNAFTAEYRAPLGKEYYCSGVTTPPPLTFYTQLKDGVNVGPVNVDFVQDDNDSYYKIPEITTADGSFELEPEGLTCTFPNPTKQPIAFDLILKKPKTFEQVSTASCNASTCTLTLGTSGAISDGEVTRDNIFPYAFLNKCLGKNGETTYSADLFAGKETVTSTVGGTSGPADYALLCAQDQYNDTSEAYLGYPPNGPWEQYVSEDKFQADCTRNGPIHQQCIKNRNQVPVPALNPGASSGLTGTNKTYDNAGLDGDGQVVNISKDPGICTFQYSVTGPSITFNNIWDKKNGQKPTGQGSTTVTTKVGGGLFPVEGYTGVAGEVGVNFKGMGTGDRMIPAFTVTEGAGSGDQHVLADYFDMPRSIQQGNIGALVSDTEELESYSCARRPGTVCRAPGIGTQGAGWGVGGSTDYRLLGCYMFAPQGENSGTAKSASIFYPWKTSAPNLFEEQIESIEIGINRDEAEGGRYYSDRSARYECSQNGVADISGRGADLRDTVAQIKLQNGSWQDNVVNDKKEFFPSAAYSFTARFDDQGKFIGIEIGYSGGEEKSEASNILVSSFKINFKPACSSFKRISDPANLERVVGDSDRLMRPDLYEKETGPLGFGSCVPWGPITYDASHPTASPAYSLVTNMTPVVNAIVQCQQRRGVAYGQSPAPALDSVFKKTYGVFTLTQKDTDNPVYRYMYGLPQDSITWFVRNANDRRVQEGVSAGTDPVIYAYNDGGRGVAGGLSVNGVASGDVVLPAGGGTITVRFYGVANKSQMPLRSVHVYAGPDYFGSTPTIEIGSEEALITSIKNRDAICDGSSFAEDRRACTESPFAFSHTYFCGGGEGLAPCNPNGSTPSQRLGCYIANYAGTGKGACVYTPGVRIKDNWGKMGTAIFGGRVIVPVQ